MFDWRPQSTRFGRDVARHRLNFFKFLTSTITSSSMPPKKRTKKAEPVAKKPGTKSSARKGSTSSKSLEDPSNARKGLVRLPIELITHILSNYKTIGNLTAIPDSDEQHEARVAKIQAAVASGPEHQDVDLLGGEPVLPRSYLERPDALRALSQTCVAYRRVFLPILFESLDVCVTTRPGNPTRAFYKHIGEALERKCSGLAKREDLWGMVRFVYSIVLLLSLAHSLTSGRYTSL